MYDLLFSSHYKTIKQLISSAQYKVSFSSTLCWCVSNQCECVLQSGRGFYISFRLCFLINALFLLSLTAFSGFLMRQSQSYSKFSRAAHRWTLFQKAIVLMMDHCCTREMNTLHQLLITLAKLCSWLQHRRIINVEDSTRQSKVWFVLYESCSSAIHELVLLLWP